MNFIKMNYLHKNGIVFLANAAAFTIVVSLKPPFFIGWMSALLLALIASYFFFSQQTYSEWNTINLGAHKVSNVNGLMLVFLFLVNVLSSWDYLDWMEITYVIVLCVIQLLITTSEKRSKAHSS